MNQCVQISHHQNDNSSKLTFQSLELVFAGASIKICCLENRSVNSHRPEVKKSKIRQNQANWGPHHGWALVQTWPLRTLDSCFYTFSKSLSSEYYHSEVLSFNMQFQDNTRIKSILEILLQQNVLGVQICQHKMVSSFILTISSSHCNTRFN